MIFQWIPRKSNEFVRFLKNSYEILGNLRKFHDSAKEIDEKHPDEKNIKEFSRTSLEFSKKCPGNLMRNSPKILEHLRFFRIS